MTSEERAGDPGHGDHQRAQEQQRAAATKPQHTGDPTVDAAMRALTEASGSPVDEQVEAYVGAHRALQDRLADLNG